MQIGAIGIDHPDHLCDHLIQGPLVVADTEGGTSWDCNETPESAWLS
jgi:hypothetical protein